MCLCYYGYSDRVLHEPVMSDVAVLYTRSSGGPGTRGAPGRGGRVVVAGAGGVTRRRRCTRRRTCCACNKPAVRLTGGERAGPWHGWARRHVRAQGRHGTGGFVRPWRRRDAATGGPKLKEGGRRVLPLPAGSPGPITSRVDEPAFSPSCAFTSAIRNRQGGACNRGMRQCMAAFRARAGSPRSSFLN